MIYPWVEVNSGQTGYSRERWCSYWQKFMKHFFDADISYDYNGSVVYWIIHDRELNKTMTTIWTLVEQGYKTSYSPTVKTFFWVDDKYYNENKKEILAWSERYGCTVPSEKHGWIQVPDDRVELLFRLQWAGKCNG
jgi:hypothetical protein